MTRTQKVVPIAVLVVMLLAIGWVLLPFDFTSAVSCKAPLLGGEPKDPTPVGLIIPEKDCRSKAKSRLLTSALICLAVAAGGTAAIAFKPVSPQCHTGNHDQCPDWWANLLSDSGESGLGCQCECHFPARY